MVMPSTRTLEENPKVTSSYSVTPTNRQVINHGVAQQQVSVHVHQGPLPVDLQAQLAQVGQEGLDEGARLPEEVVRTPGHPVADGQVSLLLSDVQERLSELDRPVRHERGEQRKLGSVDVPHGGDVERERSAGRPERALIRGHARLDQRVVQSGREYRLPVARGGV